MLILDLTGSIHHFYKGYIGYIDSYSEDYDISDIDNLRKLLDIEELYWLAGVLKIVPMIDI